ncbi:ATP-binding cassette domain-containing protein [Streptomyces coeruleorubidus]|uniref:ATP-binding cassette domain-containing protein n=1 Tax=Streptomyces coeruleorubidus TaxID=116188 RepID=UPI00379A914E
MTAHGYDLAVEVRGLRKRYGDVTAVDGIDPGIRRSEVFGLLGPNGAGKRTTVEILQGNRDRDAGEVSVLGSGPATGTRAWRSRVGIVWQDESAFAELTVRETVRHFAGYYPRPRNPEEVIGLVGLEAKADNRIKALSGGRRRHLDVALGVIGGPDLLLLDEPTTGFDPAARRQFWSLRMDLRMPGGGGVDSIVRMTRTGLPCRVVVLTTYETDRDILRAVEARAAGNLLKDLPRAELAEAVRAAARGETVLAPSVAARLVDQLRTRPERPRLSERETAVLRLVAEGCTNAEIGRRLFIGESTVMTYLLRVFGKLGWTTGRRR